MGQAIPHLGHVPSHLGHTISHIKTKTKKQEFQPFNISIKSIMKHLFLVLFLSITGLFSNQAQAAKVIPIGTVEKLKTVADLPNTEDYQDRPGEYIDLGIKYKYFHIAWMPVWIIDEPELVGLSSINKEIYYEISPEEIQAIIQENNLPPAEELKHLGFFQKYWGALVIIGIIAITFIYSSFHNKEEEEEKKEA